MVGGAEGLARAPALDPQLRDPVAEQLPQPLLGPPEDRWDETGRRPAGVLGDGDEHLADAAVRGPVGHPDRPPGLVTRSSSAAVCSWSGANIAPKIDIVTSKLGVAEGQVLGVALDELDLEPLDRRPFPPALEQGRDEVGADPPSQVRRAAAIAPLPLPQATSSTRSPGITSSASASRSATK